MYTKGFLQTMTPKSKTSTDLVFSSVCFLLNYYSFDSEARTLYLKYFSFPLHTLEYLISTQTQSCSIQNNIGVISSKFINKLVQKCQCYYPSSDQNIPLVTVTSVLSLLTEQLCTQYGIRTQSRRLFPK